MPPKKRSPPPRHSRGKQRRDTRQSAPLPGAVLWGGAAALAAALVAVVAVVALTGGGGGGPSPEQKLTAAGCTFATYPDLGNEHVESYDAKISYNSSPPTSGPHHIRPVIWGAYAEPVPAVAEVHNLEHGGVIIQYGNAVDAATRERVRAFYANSPNAMLLAPLAKLGNKIALTAWTQLATCERFDDAAFSAFRSAYRGNGPERFRIGDLAPGT